MKAVFDTNVLIAAFLTEGICAKLLIRARRRDFDLILACARSAFADYVVTGDEDLLVLKNYEGINIVKPREFEELFPD